MCTHSHTYVYVVVIERERERRGGDDMGRAPAGDPPLSGGAPSRRRVRMEKP